MKTDVEGRIILFLHVMTLFLGSHLDVRRETLSGTEPPATLTINSHNCDGISLSPILYKLL